MKKAREIVIPEDRTLEWKDYFDFSEHAKKSSSWYATEYSRTEKQVREKLEKKGYIEEPVTVKLASGETEEHHIIEETVAWLKENLILNDERVARSVIEREVRRGKGLTFARSALFRRGIESDLIEKLIDEKAEDEEAIIDSVDKAASIILRSSAYRRLEGEWERRNKLTRALIQKGFSFDDIKLWEETQD